MGHCQYLSTAGAGHHRYSVGVVLLVCCGKHIQLTVCETLKNNDAIQVRNTWWNVPGNATIVCSWVPRVQQLPIIPIPDTLLDGIKRVISIRCHMVQDKVHPARRYGRRLGIALYAQHGASGCATMRLYSTPRCIYCG